MRVLLSSPVKLALETLGDDDRRRVSAWIDHLSNWENDPHVRKISKPLPGDEKVFVLRTSSDVRIFYSIQDGDILVLDITRQDSIDRLSHSPLQKGA